MASDEPAPTPAAAAPPRQTARLIRIGLLVAILALSIWFVATNVDWTGLGAALASMNILWVIAGIACTMSAHLIRAARWRLLIPDGGSVRMLDAFSATIVGYFMNNVIPRSGELIRPYILSQRTKRPMSGLLATVVVERILDGLTLLAIFLLLLITESDRVLRPFREYTSTDLIVKLVVPVAVIGLIAVVLLRTPFGERMARFVARFVPGRFGDRLVQIVIDFRTGVSFGGLKSQLWLLAGTIGIWLGYWAALYCCVIAFDFGHLYGIGPADGVIILAITAVGVSIAPTPGAFVVYHSFCTVALTSLYHVPLSSAIAFAIVTHAAPFLTVMAVGGGFLLRENVSMKEMRRGGLRS